MLHHLCRSSRQIRTAAELSVNLPKRKQWNEKAVVQALRLPKRSIFEAQKSRKNALKKSLVLGIHFSMDFE